MQPQQRGVIGRWRRLTAAGVSTALAGLLGAVGVTAVATASSAPGKPATTPAAACKLGNGITHVVQLGFDNVHFFRDNPDVPSDLELIPNLLNFLTSNGAFLSDSHTPLISHTGDNLLTTWTGLYGDRHGNGIANAYQTYNPDGTTDPATTFTYWNDPIDDTKASPTAGHDTNPNLVYSPVPPATAKPAVTPDTVAPAPWVPYTQAGCNVGEVATVDQDLENPTFDIPQLFGAGSPEVAQLNADPDSFKDTETADYVGLAVHCAKNSTVCANAEAVKFGQTTPSHTAVPDLLPDEPGGYAGYQALFGSKYIAPVLGAGTPGLSDDGYPVTNAAGNLTDLDGNQINGAFLTNYAGFPGYSGINAAQSLAYTADMLEHGVQVVNLYMADIHGNEHIPALNSVCGSQPNALGSGSACYIAQAQYYNQAFGDFFARLAADGITPQNTLFVVSSDEGDHEAGANVGRAQQPAPAGCDGATVSGDTVTPDVLCTYTTSTSTALSGNFGELDVNVTGLLAAETGNTTPFSTEDDTAPEFYITGNPGPDTTVARNFEHGLASLTASNPYDGHASEPVANYLADPTEEAILHIADADPARTPTVAMFARPDYYLQSEPLTGACAGSNECQSTGFAWDHGDYAAEIDTNYVAFAGPGIKHLGIDGPTAAQGPNSAGPDSGQIEVADQHLPGPWVDESDIRPTILYDLGLNDDYQHDGAVISSILSKPDAALSSPVVAPLFTCYKQLDSSVGDFGAATLTADTKAIESTTPGDSKYLKTVAALRALEVSRDALAGQIKGELQAAADQNKAISPLTALLQTLSCATVIGSAELLAVTS